MQRSFFIAIVFVILLLENVVIAAPDYARALWGRSSSSSSSDSVEDRVHDRFGFTYYGDTAFSLSGIFLNEKLEDGVLRQGFTGALGAYYYPGVHDQTREESHPASLAFFLEVQALPPRGDPGVSTGESIRSFLSGGFDFFVVNDQSVLFNLGFTGELERKDPHDDNPKFGFELLTGYARTDFGVSFRDVSFRLHGEYFLGLFVGDKKREGFLASLTIGWHPDAHFDLFVRYARGKDTSREFSNLVYDYVRVTNEIQLKFMFHINRYVGIELAGEYLFGNEHETDNSLEGLQITLTLQLALP